jgi:hypothetical protein
MNFLTFLIRGDTLFVRKMTLTNLSLDKSINDFHIQLIFKKDSKSTIFGPEINPIPPATILQKDPEFIRNKFIYFPIKIIQPQMAYELQFKSNRETEHPIFFFTCNEPIKMQEKSVLTFLVHHQVELNFSIMVLFVALAVLYSLNLKKVT